MSNKPKKLDLQLIKNAFQNTFDSRRLSEHKLDKLNRHYQLLLYWNDKLNLTRIIEPEEATIKHYIDSLEILRVVSIFSIKFKDIADIGSGAGFPGMPILILCPEIDLTFVESRQKKCEYLNSIRNDLELKYKVKYKVICERAENLQKNLFFDIVVSRALAKPRISAESCFPRVRLSGYYLAMLGKVTSNDLTELNEVVKILGGKFIADHIYRLPKNMGERHIIVYKKIKETPAKYPRPFSKIKSSLP